MSTRSTTEFPLIRLLVPTLLAALTAGVQAATPVEVAGGQDHPLVTRFKGSVLHNVASEAFASVRIPIGPGHRNDDGKMVYDKAITTEGRLGSYFYVAPTSTTPLEVFRNYQNALQQAGFTIAYSCEAKDCERSVRPEALRRELLAPRPWGGGINPASGSSPRELRYLVARGKSAGNDVTVVVWVTEPTSVWSAPAATLLVAEATPMSTGNVTASQQQLQAGLKAEGKVAIYGLYFDTGKAEIKPESKAQLDEMSKLLKTDASLRVFIVGHTDNQGSVDGNLALSRRRAEAVVAALGSQYGIDAKRLSAQGVANFAPVASNADEGGRAKNRRVELVVQ
jgi:outer membrane protein OmpA-like peptidoglycan-associated protein